MAASTGFAGGRVSCLQPRFGKRWGGRRAGKPSSAQAICRPGLSSPQSSRDSLSSPDLALFSLAGLAWHPGKGVKENLRARKAKEKQTEQKDGKVAQSGFFYRN